MANKMNERNRKYYLTALENHPLFALLPKSKHGQEAKDRLLSQVVLHEYAKDEIIFLQHDVVANLYFLLAGEAVCHRQLPSGQECLIANYQTLSLINESVLWDWQHFAPKNIPPIIKSDKKPDIASKHSALLIKQGGIHQLTATAKEKSIVASLSVQAYFKIIEQFELGGLITWFCECISKRLYHHLISSDLLAFVQAKSKLGYYLLTHYNHGVPFCFQCSQKQLASQIGLRPETLSRTLKDFIELGLIVKQDKHHYMICDIQGLLDIVSQ